MSSFYLEKHMNMIDPFYSIDSCDSFHEANILTHIVVVYLTKLF
jgi:hypothetical protein